jgi:uncharacterized membrane protein
MKKILTALTAAAALAAGTMATTTKANAYAWWVIPAIVGAGVGGLAVGAAAENNAQYAGGPRGNVYVRPSAYNGAGYSCRTVDEQSPSGRIRHVRVCN